jgi:hypothetical protein
VSSFGLLQRCQVKRSAPPCDQDEVAMRSHRVDLDRAKKYHRVSRARLSRPGLRTPTSEEQLERQLADTGVERRSDAAEGAVGHGSIRIAEVSVIQDVEVLRPELELD